MSLCETDLSVCLFAYLTKYGIKPAIPRKAIDSENKYFISSGKIFIVDCCVFSTILREDISSKKLYLFLLSCFPLIRQTSALEQCQIGSKGGFNTAQI